MSRTIGKIIMTVQKRLTGVTAFVQAQWLRVYACSNQTGTTAIPARSTTDAYQNTHNHIAELAVVVLRHSSPSKCVSRP